MNCTKCNRQLRQPSHELEHQQKCNCEYCKAPKTYLNTMHIIMQGGYYEFIDGLADVILCPWCCVKFFEENKWLLERFQLPPEWLEWKYNKIEEEYKQNLKS